jgi:hypothetical protein
MTRNVAAIAVAASSVLFSGSATDARAQRARAVPQAHQQLAQMPIPNDAVTVRPGALAALADALAGRAVRLLDARVVGVFEPRVFLVESQTRWRPIVDRDRVLVFVETGALRVDPAVLVATTVTISGVARTLLGMQVSGEVPWPATLTPETVRRLDIRAAVLASAVRTPEGVDLLTRRSASAASVLHERRTRVGAGWGERSVDEEAQLLERGVAECRACRSAIAGDES